MPVIGQAAQPTTLPSGAMTMYAGTAAPSGWLVCDGSPISRTTYAALYAVIGTSYGAGDGSTTFNLPNMQDRTVIGASSTKALASQGGTLDGNHTHTDAHTHTLSAHTHTFNDGGHVHGSSSLKAEITVTTGGVKINRVATLSWTSNSEANSVSNTSGGNPFSTGAPIDGNTDSATASGTTAGPSTANTSARSTASTGTPNSAGTNPGLPGYTSMNYIIKT